MTSIIYFIVKKTIDVVNNKGKIYFALKLQDYEKNKEENKKEEKNIVKEENEENNNIGKNVIYLSEKREFEVDNIFKLTKMVDDKFSIDYCNIIHKFINNNVIKENNGRYDKLMSLKNSIEEKGVYNLLTSNEEEKAGIISLIKQLDSEILNEYSSYHEKFDIVEFLNYLETEISKVDPTIYILVGQRDVDYNYLDRRIKTIYKEKIYKGIKIIYHNKMYDYSLD